MSNHLRDGATKVGLFCLVRACLDRLQSDGEISVVHALHHMRARRNQVIPNFVSVNFNYFKERHKETTILQNQEDLMIWPAFDRYYLTFL